MRFDETKIINEKGFLCYVDNQIDEDCLYNLEDCCDTGDQLRAQGKPHTECPYWRIDSCSILAQEILEAINDECTVENKLEDWVSNVIFDVLCKYEIGGKKDE